MIRPFTCLCMLLAGAAGLYLYQVKHRTSMLDREIVRIVHETEAARAATGRLQAEWQLLNQPERLADLAGRFLALQPLAPTQFVRLADLDARLPAIKAPAQSEATDTGEAADAAPVAAGAPIAAPVVAAMATAARPADPAVAVSRPALPVAVAAVRPRLVERAAPKHEVAIAEALPLTRGRPVAPYPPGGAAHYAEAAYTVPSYLQRPYTPPLLAKPWPTQPVSALGGVKPALAAPIPVVPATGSPAGGQ